MKVKEPKEQTEETKDPVVEMNIYQRLHAIMNESGVVAKDGQNTFHKYKYATAASYIRQLKPLLAKYRVVVTPEVVNFAANPAKPELVSMVMTYTFVNVDKPEEKVKSSIVTSGEDKGDKAVFKAMTSGQKYAFAQTFVLETGDDPEADAETDKRNEAPKSDKATKPKTGGFASKVTGGF